MDKAEQIVKAIEADFTNRRGLRQEWERINSETQQEIRATWANLIRKEFAMECILCGTTEEVQELPSPYDGASVALCSDCFKDWSQKIDSRR
jgi:hypothetical protein